MKQLFLILTSALCVLSCQSSEERAINEVLNGLDGNWKITSFRVNGNAADSLKNYFKEGSLRFDPCTYTEKHFADESRVCGGTGRINGQEVSFTHRFFKHGVPFAFRVYLMPQPVNRADIPSLLTDGRWEFHLERDQLKARQINNYAFPLLQAEFTATKN